MAARRSAEPHDLAARIRGGLDALKLKHAAARFEELLANPEGEQSRLEWLWSLLEPQVCQRVEARVERRIRESKLPGRKTLEAFDFSFQPALDEDLILELGTLAFLDQGKNILLAGMSGTGKSHIAKALALNACRANRRVRYTTSEAMLGALSASLVTDTLTKDLKAYTRPDLLVIDEVGLEQVEQPVAKRSGLMQKVLIPRYEPPRSTIITSNIPWDAWGDYLDDHLGATALIDRLLHHSHVIVIDGPSYREHSHKQEVEKSRERRRVAKKSRSRAAKKTPSNEKKRS